jgi:hypothetical protein
MPSFRAGLIARSAQVDTTPPNTIRALAGIFNLTGETMTVIAGYALTASAGAFALAGQSATLTPPVAAYTGPGDVSGWGTAYGYWGLRAYNASRIGLPCIDVASNLNGPALNLTTVNIGSDGYVDLTPLSPGTFPTIYVQRIYDQSGAGKDLFSQDNRAKLLLNQVGGKPVMEFVSAQRYLSATNAVAQIQPITIGAVADLGTGGMVMCDGTFGFQAMFASGTGSVDARHYFGTSTQGVTGVSPGTMFSVISKAQGATSSIAINGVVTTDPGNPGTGGISGTDVLAVGATSGGAAAWGGPGRLYEIIKAGAVSNADQTALSTNQHLIGTGW